MLVYIFKLMGTRFLYEPILSIQSYLFSIVTLIVVMILLFVYG